MAMTIYTTQHSTILNIMKAINTIIFTPGSIGTGITSRGVPYIQQIKVAQALNNKSILALLNTVLFKTVRTYSI